MDLHAGQIQGFFNVPFDHLFAMPVFLEYLRPRFGEGAGVRLAGRGRRGARARLRQAHEGRPRHHRQAS
jgi:ribose-phosphate pyrophosphokinase